MQDVVGLGGSAGSIEALKMFFSYMPEESGLAFVVVHLSPEYESHLEGVLQKWTSMPVIRVSEPIKVEANCVYVIPPGKHLLMADGHLTLTVLPHEYGKRSAVDIFFRTLAETHRVPLDRYSSVRDGRRRRYRNQADQRGWRNHCRTETGGGAARRDASICD